MNVRHWEDVWYLRSTGLILRHNGFNVRTKWPNLTDGLLSVRLYVFEYFYFTSEIYIYINMLRYFILKIEKIERTLRVLMNTGGGGHVIILSRLRSIYGGRILQCEVKIQNTPTTIGPRIRSGRTEIFAMSKRRERVRAGYHVTSSSSYSPRRPHRIDTRNVAGT